MPLLFQLRPGAKFTSTSCLPLAEDLLWERLEGGQLMGACFSRNFEIGDQVADFVCEDLRIAVLVDGCALRGMAGGTSIKGYMTVPVRSSDVYNDIDAVYARISEAVRARSGQTTRLARV